MCPSAPAAVTEQLGLRGVNNRHFSSPRSRRLEVQDLGVGSVVSPEASLLGLQTDRELLAGSPRGLPSAHTLPSCLCVRISSFCKDTGHIGLGPNLMASF